MSGPEQARALSALHSIPPDLPRDEWVKAGMAAKAAGLDFEDFDAWSANASSYDSRAAGDTWRSMKDGGGIGAGTLYRMAGKHGWREHRPGPRKAPGRPAEPPKQPRHGMGAAEVWARCKPATDAHPYILAKQGRPEGLRVVPDGDPLVVAGLSMVGALVVPVTPLAGGEPTSFQFIAPPDLATTWKAAGRPSKLNLPGAPMAGVFIVGELLPGGLAYVAEGIGQAWACWKATGAAAVVSFGAGRMRVVAAELRQRDASARLVLVPDAGKEDDVEAIALEVSAELVTMPEGSPPNFDANDYAEAEGHDALEVLLSGAWAPQQMASAVHPLARFVEFGAEPVAPRFVIPGFIGHGLVVFAGTHGVGKTTTLLPLALVAAGLHRHDDPLAPKHWRHVVYIVEDAEQARRILAGIVKFGGLGLDVGAVRERLHLVEARRLDPEFVAKVGATYRGQFARTVDGVEVLPLVVMDTKSAVLEMEEENSNSEASAIVALLKQSFEGLPVWLVGHVSKANMSRADVAGLSLRGGSAFEADANQTLYLVKEEGDRRYLVRGKTRFEAEWPELEVGSDTAHTVALNEFGEPQPVTLRWGTVRPPDQTRAEARKTADATELVKRQTELRSALLDAVEAAERTGRPLSWGGATERVGGKASDARACVSLLEDELWLLAVTVPTALRTNPKRSEFLIRLSDEERRALSRGQPLPEARLEVPPSWRKSDASQPDATDADRGVE